MLGHQGDGFLPIGSLGHDVDVAACLQELSDALAHYSVIVGQDDADRLGVAHSCLRLFNGHLLPSETSSYHSSRKAVNVRSGLAAVCTGHLAYRQADPGHAAWPGGKPVKERWRGSPPL